MALMRAFLSPIVDFFYPPTCLVCGARLDNAEQVEPRNADDIPVPPSALCAMCEPFSLIEQFPLRLSMQQCRLCGETISSDRHAADKCLSCLVDPLPFRQLRSLTLYTKRVEAVIKALKYGLRRPLASVLAQALARSIRGQCLFSAVDWQAIIPLPSAQCASRKRGFAHTALIARSLAQILSLPVDLFALRSLGKRLPQISLTPAERYLNVQSAFCADPRHVAGKRLLLLDDVVTTGASLSAAANALLKAGALSVDALTVARSQQFGLYRQRAAAVHAVELLSAEKKDNELERC